VSAAESELERLLSGQLMQGDRAVRQLRAGERLVTEGDSDREIYLVLDGLLEVEVGGRVVGRVGPGAIVGERSHLHGRRTATLRAVTPCRVAESQPERFQPDHMQQLAESHRAEEADTEAE
jgi:CRP-like cAMP-binding protein